MSIHTVQTSDPTHLETVILLHLLWSQALKQRLISHVVPLIQPGPKGSTANDSPSISTSQGGISNVFSVKQIQKGDITYLLNGFYQDKGPQTRIGP